MSEEWFPKQDARAGGTIYIGSWAGIARRTRWRASFGHEDVFELLMERTPEELKLALACELGDEEVFRKYLALNRTRRKR